MHSSPSFPYVTNSNFPWITDSANLLNKLYDTHAYINYEVLTYVINLPVANRETSEVLNRFLHQ